MAIVAIASLVFEPVACLIRCLKLAAGFLNNFPGVRIDFDPVRDNLPSQHQN